MKADVVICFYKKQHLWPLVLHGLLLNKDHIGTVYVVNDERWDESVRTTMARQINGRLTVHWLWHEHDGFGHHKSLNQGARAVKTPYFIHMDDDIVLMEGCVKRLLEDVDDQTLVAGICHDVSPDLTIKDLEGGEKRIWRMDTRTKTELTKEMRWMAVRDCLLCCNKEAFLALGGRDEGYKGYGFIDYDFGVRWMMKHGLDSFIIGRGVALNICGPDQHPHMWDKPNFDRFFKKRQEWETYLANNHA